MFTVMTNTVSSRNIFFPGIENNIFSKLYNNSEKAHVISPIFENVEVFRSAKLTEQIRPSIPDSKLSVTTHGHLFNGNLESSAGYFPVHFKEYKPHENETYDTLFVVCIKYLMFQRFK